MKAPEGSDFKVQWRSPPSTLDAISKLDFETPLGGIDLSEHPQVSPNYGSQSKDEFINPVIQ